MTRGEVWWARLPAPAGRRPVVLVSREGVYAYRELLAVVPVTTRVRGLPTEVALGGEEGLPRRCVANADVVNTIPKRCLERRIGPLPGPKLAELDGALRFALGLD